MRALNDMPNDKGVFAMQRVNIWRRSRTGILDSNALLLTGKRKKLPVYLKFRVATQTLHVSVVSVTNGKAHGCPFLKRGIPLQLIYDKTATTRSAGGG